ncbi:23453_t:CDS:1, partial [Gigaspora margarita]
MIMIINGEGKKVTKITNKIWASKEKVCLITLVIIIVIHKDKAEIEIEMNMDVILKIVDKINNPEYKRSGTIRKKLGHITNTIRIMKE